MFIGLGFFIGGKYKGVAGGRKPMRGIGAEPKSDFHNFSTILNHFETYIDLNFHLKIYSDNG